MAFTNTFTDAVKDALASLKDSAAGGKASDGTEAEMGETQTAILEVIVEQAEEEAKRKSITPAKSLEVALRTILTEYLSVRVDFESEESIEESWARVKILLDSTLWLYGREKVDPVAFMFLLRDLAEEASLTVCEKLFQYIETKQPGVMTEKGNRTKFLQMSNNLLRRLSREDNPGMCGRLLILVAKLLPLSERSGVNLTGGFDVANTTDFVELEEGAKDESGRPIDVDLYNSLWRVQGLLSNPPLILIEKHWTSFQSSLKRVFSGFDRTSAKQEDGRDLSSNAYDSQSLKYSTSPNLLQLQLQDTTFKCEYLFQVLLVLNHLKIETPTRKPPLNQSAADRSLRQRQLDDLPKLESLAKACLSKFAPPETFNLIKIFIQREKHWILWKKVGKRVDPAAGSGPGDAVKTLKCPPFEKEARPEDLEMFRESKPSASKGAPGGPFKRKRAAMVGFRKNQVKLGNEALDRLWNISQDNYECLDFEDQEKVPKMEDLVQRVVTQAQADSGVDESEKLANDKLYCWRVKRLLAQGDSKNFVAHCDEALERLLPAVFPDLRGQFPEPTPPSEPEPVKEEEGGEGAATKGQGGSEVVMGEAGEAKVEEEGEGVKAEVKEEVKQEGL